MSETVTVRDRIEQLLGEIHGLAVTRQQQETIYAVISHSTTWDEIEEGVEADIPVLDIRTVVIDLDSESVSLSDNGIWIPRDPDSSEALTRLLARTTNELGDTIQPDADPLETAAIDLDPDLLLARELEIEEDISEQHSDKMRRHGGIDPKRAWGYGSSPPPEIERVIERLEEIGEDPSQHTTRLVWGKKEPMTRTPRPIDELLGNYGIELLPQSEGLIALDIDYPEQFPDAQEDLPDTLEISSPHGGDEQRHVILHCRSKDDLANELGAWAIQGVSWGDLWIGDRYLVGPGSQLSEWGCDEGEHDRGEPGGCSECEDPEGGYYEILEDRPIATVDSEDILELIDQSSGYEIRDRGADPDLPQEDNEEPEQLEDDLEDPDRAVTVTCDSCGSALEEDERKTVELLGEQRTICRGGCQ